MTDITYRVEGDYLIPELILDGEGNENCPEEEIGQYGEMRERFPRERQHGTYTEMLLMGSLTTHLQEIDRQVEEEVECLLRKMMERQGVDEALKASDQMLWVQKVNALRSMAEEVVMQEIVYQKMSCGRQDSKGLYKYMGMKSLGTLKGQFRINM